MKKKLDLEYVRRLLDQLPPKLYTRGEILNHLLEADTKIRQVMKSL